MFECNPFMEIIKPPPDNYAPPKKKLICPFTFQLQLLIFVSFWYSGEGLYYILVTKGTDFGHPNPTGMKCFELLGFNNAL